MIVTRELILMLLPVIVLQLGLAVYCAVKSLRRSAKSQPLGVALNLSLHQPDRPHYIPL